MERFRNVLCLSRRTKRQQSRHAENYQTSPHVHLPEARAHPRPDQRSVEAPLLADIAHFGRSDEAAMSDPDGGERAIKVMCPEIQEFDGAFTSIPADIIRTFISHTAFAITNEESRYTLSGAKFELWPDKARMVATDGHRLSFIEKSIKLGEVKLDVLIPKKTLSEVGRLCAEAEEIVDIGYNGNYLFFKFGKRLLISRTLTGQFPNYEMVLPKESNNKVSFPSQHLANAIRRVSLMADERSRAIKLEISLGKMNVTAPASETGEASDSLSSDDYTGPDIVVAFNAQYLLDFFGVIQDGEILIEFNDGNSQTQFKVKDESEYDFRYIVMPMRL